MKVSGTNVLWQWGLHTPGEQFGKNRLCIRLFHFRTATASGPIAIRGLDKNSNLAKAVRVRALINLAFAHQANFAKAKCERGFI